MNTLKLTVLGTPKPKQSARFRMVKGKDRTFITSYQKKEVKDAERNFAFDVKSQLPLGFVPYDCAIGVKVLFVFPPNSGFSKKKLAELEAGKVFHKHTKPDLQDNLFKGCADSLEGIVFVNDSRICKVESEKIYGLVPRVELEFYTL